MDSKSKPSWYVEITRRTAKEKNKLPVSIQQQVLALLKELETRGPLRANWANFGPLHKGKRIPSSAFHCHLKKGKPTFVTCWRIISKKEKWIEVYYVGTHENAPY